MYYTLNVKGRLAELCEPQVMGILNVTPDSFYADSRRQTEEQIAARANEIVSQGATMIDVGACSTRPGAEPASQAEEMARLRLALPIVRREQPDAIISVDTFRPDVARMAVEEYGADIVNDVGQTATHHPTPITHHPTPITQHPTPNTQHPSPNTQHPTPEMFRIVSRLRVPYIYMSSASTLRDVLLDFAERVQQLRDLGQKDIILDPGFGFGKTLEQNYELLRQLECLQVMELPLLVGLSRKSMIYKLLGTTPDHALNGTTALNTIALQKGASILRVHDVAEAVELIKIKKIKNKGLKG